MNAIYLRRRSKVCVSPGHGEASPEQLATVQKEVAHLGYVLAEPLMARLSTFEPAALATFLRTLLHDLQQLTGAHRHHEPLYPGFPEQVLQRSEAELYLDAVAHYLTHRRLFLDEDRPSRPLDDDHRPALLDERAPAVIELGSREEFEGLLTQWASAGTSLSQQDKDDMAWFVRQYRADVFRLLPSKIPFRENLALLGGLLATHVPGDASIAWIRVHVSTATDVLRLAVALSDGDVSLAKPCKFRSFMRAERRLLLDLLERIGKPTEDMLRWPERWKRLGERLHPREMRTRFPLANGAFDVLRNGLPFETFNATVEQALSQGDAARMADLLEERPGEYARKLDVLLRHPQADETTVRRFAGVADRVSTPVLLQVLAHFKHRSAPAALRTYFPKGEVAKVFAEADTRVAIAPGLALAVVEVCEQALIARFSTRPPLGACFVDEALAKCTVPLAQRSASKSLRTLGRGSRLPLPKGHTVRLFLWWMNGSGRTDIDLSAVLYGDEYQYLDMLSFHNLKGFGGHHSGDIVDAPKGAAEFIDLDLGKLRERGVRFVVMAINSYTAQRYGDLPECFAGWMLRQHPNSGEIFEPRTVVDKVDLASDTRICLPLILDLREQEVLWADIALRDDPRWRNSVRNNLAGVSLMLRALSSMVRPDLQTLFNLHARARGHRVDQAEGADTVFALHEGVTPFCTDDIRSLYL
ncbi:TerD family protein [Hydrogenophaga sp.]|uniref:TerD family protein n=1 Tax=Hydrogenophaga sp. TaxID=1904254 RepID=UPI002728CF19|nr:TerD family protein [Hydrogenophaga sp.]MDO9433860.1 TerD family protein [Hydrogenophaga sp.]